MAPFLVRHPVLLNNRMMAREKVLATASAPDAEGWVIATIPIESIGVASWELLRFGAEAEVLEPIELREAIADQANKMAMRYAGASGR